MKLMHVMAVMAIVAGTHLPAQEPDSGLSQDAQDFLQDLLEEMQPAWRELQGFMDAMGPAILELMEEIKDWSAYEAPEILENGDIIIRRKPDQTPQDTQDLPPPVEL